MMKKVIILHGCSGAGKSTYAQSIRGALIVSADGFFERCGGFDALKLQEAHNDCLRDFINLAQILQATSNGNKIIIVDNTNTTKSEVWAYVRIAHAYGYAVEHIVFRIDPAIAAARSSKHGIPIQTVERQARSIRRLLEKWPFPQQPNVKGE